MQDSDLLGEGANSGLVVAAGPFGADGGEAADEEELRDGGEGEDEGGGGDGLGRDGEGGRWAADVHGFADDPDRGGGDEEGGASEEEVGGSQGGESVGRD